MRGFLGWVAPAVLLLASSASAFLAGMRMVGSSDGRSVWHAVLFAVSMLLAEGAHAAGHYVAAGQGGVEASLPYFIPALTITGTSGAYVKLRWPISDMRTLFRVFAAGPIAGFIASSLLFFAGLALSDVVRRDPTQVVFGDSLLIATAQRIAFPGQPPTDDVVLHPVAMAGYVGLLFNLWHLFPVGRLDGGRVVYALFGYRPALVVSWVTIGALAILVTQSPAWLGLAVFAALTMIRVSRQHPVERQAPPLDAATVCVALVMAGILMVTFVPVPVRLGP